jgi:hypothetical protein
MLDESKSLENARRTVLMKKTPLELPTNWLSSFECAVREPISDGPEVRSEESIVGTWCLGRP